MNRELEIYEMMNAYSAANKPGRANFIALLCQFHQQVSSTDLRAQQISLAAQEVNHCIKNNTTMLVKMKMRFQGRAGKETVLLWVKTKTETDTLLYSDLIELTKTAAEYTRIGTGSNAFLCG